MGTWAAEEPGRARIGRSSAVCARSSASCEFFETIAANR